MSDNELLLKPVSDLLGEQFFIPSYQRGYRWTKRQVTNLLDDIAEFQGSSEDSQKSVFYCLQPIVVKKHGNEWELVDGQQRLTTIYIILQYLKDITNIMGLEKSCYSLRFETRPNSAVFLESIDLERGNENIDFYHICQAWEAIIEWFDKKSIYKLKFLSTLLNDDTTGKNVKVIWYQLNESSEPTTVFSRLNQGKIPLTNAELVKALFLHSSNFESLEPKFQQLKMAQEWDDIERRMQQDAFWHFISNTNVKSNRIEFILKIIADMPEIKSNIPSQDPYYVFLTFTQHLENLREAPHYIEKEWWRIKRLFMLLNEWFENRETYHLIGYLISINEDIPAIIKINSGSETKKLFSQRLRQKIFSITHPSLAKQENIDYKLLEEDISSLSYPNNRLRAILLLFNIATLQANKESNARFQFDRYKCDKWDIEHINSVSSQMPRNIPSQQQWVRGIYQHFQQNENTVLGGEQIKIKSQIFTKAKELLHKEKFDQAEFGNLFDLIQKQFRENKLIDLDGNMELDNSIGNLTLLDKETNRSYKNAIFPIKRRHIIEVDKKATFVPIATKNVFLKYYSKHAHDMTFWYKEDHESYKKAIVDTHFDFFKGEK